jgi:hypothetical protein
MPASKNILDTIRKLANREISGNVKIGELPEPLLRDLAQMNARYRDPAAFLGYHGATSRNIKDKGSLERTADAYRKLLDSEKTQAIPNFPGRRTSEALLLPDSPKSLFAPVGPGNAGEINISTIIDPENKKVLSHLEQLLASREVGKLSSMSRDHRAISAGVPSTQRRPISAVEEQAAIEELISLITGKVKTVAPVAATGGLLGMMGQVGEAAAAAPEPEYQWAQWDDAWGSDPPLESPVVDPIDMMLAPIGAATWLGKAAAVAAEPAISIGMNYLFNQGE